METRRDEHLEELLADALEPVHEKLNLILINQGAEMADVTEANAILTEIEGEKSELVKDYENLLTKIAGLSTEHTPTDAELKELVGHAAKVSAGFKVLHEAEASGAPAPSGEVPPPVEEPVPPPVEPPAETPPAEQPAPAEEPPVTNPPETPTA